MVTIKPLGDPSPSAAAELVDRLWNRLIAGIATPNARRHKACDVREFVDDLDWRQLDERIEGACHAGRRMRTTDERARDRPIISSAMVAAIGTGDAFARPRLRRLAGAPDYDLDRRPHDPRKISKRGNRYLRVLFVQAAWVVMVRPKNWERHGLKPWIEAEKRLHHYLCSNFRS
jgi:hypothetical protein